MNNQNGQNNGQSVYISYFSGPFRRRVEHWLTSPIAGMAQNVPRTANSTDPNRFLCSDYYLVVQVPPVPQGQQVQAAGVGGGANVQANGVVNNPAINPNENPFNSGV
jgi:hypothetical protein